MALDLKTITPDKELASEGVWLPYSGAEFKIASQDTSRYDTAMMKNSRKQNAAELRRKPEIMQEVIITTIAETILLDWKGVEENGTPLPCTLANKKKILGIRELREWISAQSAEVENFRKEAIAADAEDLKSGPDLAPEVGSE